jgi:hypothetical protein
MAKEGLDKNLEQQFISNVRVAPFSGGEALEMFNKLGEN